MFISHRHEFVSWQTPFADGILMPATVDEAATVRIGYQKGDPILVAAMQTAHFDKPGLQTQWMLSDSGRALLEAVHAETVDLVCVGDTPALFEQAAHGELVYVAAETSHSVAILLPPGSTIETLRDLKGRRIAFPRGSSAHRLVDAALAKVGLTHSDITPVNLAPADAAAAFMGNDIDAWAIWDPYCAMVELQRGVRVLATAASIGSQHSFYLATRRFATRNHALLARMLGRLTVAAAWAQQHREEVAALISASTSVPLPAMRIVMQRHPCSILPMTDAIIGRQQQAADRFLALGLLARAVQVRDAVWHADT